jgi:transposase
MATSIVKSVETQPVGFAPILQCYFERCRIAKIIDDNIKLDPRRKILTHGQASVAMITGILFQVLQLYRICKFATETTVLDVILPGIAPDEYFDDRLADTLDAIFDYGIGNLEMLITQHVIREFNIKNDICHNDTTSASTYGNCNKNRTSNSIEITFGYSKKHRQDLKQLVWSLSVSSDSAFPLFQKAYSGNTADVDTYVEQWQNLIDLLGHQDFLYVADSKLITKENMAQIHNNNGFFIAPAPMYESYKKILHTALENHSKENLIFYKNQFNRGFETSIEIEYEAKTYTFRMIILYDQNVAARKRNALQARAAKTQSLIEELQKKLNKYKLKTEMAIEQACNSILKKYRTADFFHYAISNNPITTYKNNKKGRPAINETPEKIAVVTDNFSITLQFDQVAFDKELALCGYYPLITNKPEDALSIEEAMLAHKNQYKCEHINRRAKSSLNIEPIYLQTPERIEAMLFLFKTALQMVVLIERTARANIDNRDKGLDNFMPNKKDVRKPRTEYMFSEFQYIVSGKVPMPGGQISGFVSELNPLQKDILHILEVPFECYSYEYLFNTR